MSTDFAGITDTDLVPAALTGYRQWRTSLDGTLRSVSYDYTWSKTESASCREMHARRGWKYGISDVHPNQIPADNCGCGIYGWYSPDHSYSRHSGDVLGVVKVSGLTLMGTHGFRTQKAEIVAVSKPKGLEAADVMVNESSFQERRATSDELSDMWAEGVMDKYPGVVVYDTPDELIYNHPPTDVTELVGESPVSASFEGYPTVIAAFYSLNGRNFAVTRWHWQDVLDKLMERIGENPGNTPDLAAFIDRRLTEL